MPATLRYDSHVSAGGLLPAAGMLRNPHAGDAAIARAVATLFGNMVPAYGGTLGIEGVWVIVTYLGSLPVPADVATESWVKN
jgi:hypothetical protein